MMNGVNSGHHLPLSPPPYPSHVHEHTSCGHHEPTGQVHDTHASEHHQATPLGHNHNSGVSLNPKPHVQSHPCGAHHTSTPDIHDHAAGTPEAGKKSPSLDKKKKKSFITTLNAHPVLNSIQAGSSLLMIPMLPLMAQEVFRSTNQLMA